MIDLASNIEVLRQSDMPQASISLLMIHYPCAAYVSNLWKVKEIGFNPLKRPLSLGSKCF
ncbi:hypothetical protein CR513_57870, partial [Mucuna pruriens]